MKSWQIARGVLLRGLKKKRKILCVREFQNSLDDSVMAVLQGQAEIIGCAEYYDFQKTKIYGKNGTEFSFKGIRRNINSIKSFEGADLVWNEEAQDTSKDSMNKLYATIRRDGAQILTSFNPVSESDPIYVRHVKNHNAENSYLCRVGYLDNPWIDKGFVEEANQMMQDDYDAYAHVYLGECWSRSDAQILKGKWVVEAFEAEQDWDGPYFGADWGFSQDPTVLVKMWVGSHVKYGENCLYVEYESRGVQVEMEDISTLFSMIPSSKKYTIRADNSRPETISYVARRGFNVVSCAKWDGCVEDGIEFLRSFNKIVIHPRCKHTATEARLYSYKTDKLTNDILPDIISKHDHCIDAIRYGIEPMIRKRIFGFTQAQVRAAKAAPRTTTAPKEGDRSW